MFETRSAIINRERRSRLDYRDRDIRVIILTRAIFAFALRDRNGFKWVVTLRSNLDRDSSMQIERYRGHNVSSAVSHAVDPLARGSLQ
jgi:hypothetical protein